MNIARPLIVLLTVIALHSCTPKEYTPLNADVKAAFNYQAGSYWVYTDAETGETDSFSVVNNFPQTIDAIRETYFIYVNRYNFYTTSDTSSQKLELSGDQVQTYALGTTVRYPFVKSITATGATVLRTNETLTLNGQTFTDVATVARTVKTPDVYTDTFYINATVGIVKLKEYRKIGATETTKVLELQRWKVIR